MTTIVTIVFIFALISWFILLCGIMKKDDLPKDMPKGLHKQKTATERRK